MPVSIEQISDAMFELVKKYTGQKQYTARELTKEMLAKFGSETDRTSVKEALRALIDSGRCVYTYRGSSYVELPESAHKGSE
jgi:hypothetical protein